MRHATCDTRQKFQGSSPNCDSAIKMADVNAKQHESDEDVLIAATAYVMVKKNKKKIDDGLFIHCIKKGSRKEHFSLWCKS